MIYLLAAAFGIKGEGGFAAVSRLKQKVASLIESRIGDSELSTAAICIAVLTMGLTFEGGAIKYWSAFSQTLNYTAVAGVCACVIGWSRTSQPDAWLNRGLCWRPLPFLGKYSYSIYMFHIWFDAVGRGTKMHPATNPAWRLWGSTLPMIAYFLTILAVVCIWALITWNLLERRFLALKDRFGYRAASERR